VTDDPALDRRSVELNEQARRAFLESATKEWYRANGRPPTEVELRRLLARYPGDPMIRRDVRRDPG
jgi:hypothetical protein